MKMIQLIPNNDVNSTNRSSKMDDPQLSAMDGHSTNGEDIEPVPIPESPSIHAQPDVALSVLYGHEQPAYSFWQQTIPAPSKRAVTGADTGPDDDKAKRQKFEGICPCCGRVDVTLSRCLARPTMCLAVGLVSSFRKIFESVQWHSMRICETCYRGSGEAMAKARHEFGDIRQLDAPAKGGVVVRPIQHSTCFRHAQKTLVSLLPAIPNRPSTTRAPRA